MKLILGHSLDETSIIFTGEPNNHLFVSGISGSGKSYCLQRLAEQAVAKQARVIVFDYTGDYRSYVSPEGFPFQHIDVCSPEFQVNPLAAVPGISCSTRTQRLIDVLCTAHPRLGTRTRLELIKHVPDYLDTCPNASISGLIQYLQMLPITKGIQDSCALLAPLGMLTGGCGAAISLDLDSPGLVVLDFFQIEAGWLRRFLVDVILRAIWDQRVHSDHHIQQPLILLLDECQDLDWREDSMPVRIMRQGRKFQIAGWFSTQWVPNKTAAAALKQASMQLYFRQNHDDAMRAAKVLSQNKPERTNAISRALSSLHVGEFIAQDVQGQIRKGHVTFLIPEALEESRGLI